MATKQKYVYIDSRCYIVQPKKRVMRTVVRSLTVFAMMAMIALATGIVSAHLQSYWDLLQQQDDQNANPYDFQTPMNGKYQDE